MVKGLPSQWGSCFRTVSLRSVPIALSYWEATIAVGCENPDIIIFSAITGSQIAVLSGHTNWVRSVTFSSDGRSLASGSGDTTVKLWDVQTGGVIRTFHGHSEDVYSVSISGDYTMIASGSRDWTIRLWDIQTGECLYTAKWWGTVQYVIFSPTDPQHITSISSDKAWEWDINSQQISSSYDATSLAFSPDHTQLALCYGEVIAAWDFNSGVMIAQSNVAGVTPNYCCFSPDGKLLAAAASKTAYVWDITNPDFCLIETFVGHTSNIVALIFSSPSSLTSASIDKSIKFWQIGAFSRNQIASDSESAPLVLSPILSVSLQTAAGIAISSDEAGIVKTWDLSTGLCKTSTKTPVGNNCWRDAQLIGSKLIIVWYESHWIYIWDINKNKLLWTVDCSITPEGLRISGELRGLRISGDGTKIFYLNEALIHVWSVDTGGYVGGMKLDLGGRWYLDPLQMDGSRIWVRLENLSTQGWKFGNSSYSIIPSTRRPPLDFVVCWGIVTPPWIAIGGREVFQLSERHAKPGQIRWDGQYLIASYDSGELLILDFNMYPQ